MKYILMAFVFSVSLSALAAPAASGGGAPQGGEQTTADITSEDCAGAVSNATGSKPSTTPQTQQPNVPSTATGQ